jgi:hypothetical protein
MQLENAHILRAKNRVNAIADACLIRLRGQLDNGAPVWRLPTMKLQSNTITAALIEAKLRPAADREPRAWLFPGRPSAPTQLQGKHNSGGDSPGRSKGRVGRCEARRRGCDE